MKRQYFVRGDVVEIEELEAARCSLSFSTSPNRNKKESDPQKEGDPHCEE
jgi:hypothetical protein